METYEVERGNEFLPVGEVLFYVGYPNGDYKFKRYMPDAGVLQSDVRRREDIKFTAGDSADIIFLGGAKTREEAESIIGAGWNEYAKRLEFKKNQFAIFSGLPDEHKLGCLEILLSAYSCSIRTADKKKERMLFANIMLLGMVLPLNENRKPVYDIEGMAESARNGAFTSISDYTNSFLTEEAAVNFAEAALAASKAHLNRP